jgi:hypothetical protein
VKSTTPPPIRTIHTTPPPISDRNSLDGEITLPPPKKPRVEKPIYVPTPLSLLKTLNPASHTSKPQNNKTASSRAKELLIFGCMPLFPPAQWDWTGEATVTLPGDVTTRLWPPQGWRHLTPDQRKLQWEFMAFQYEQSSGRVSSLDRTGLLDTYNMFALPGTAPHAKVKNGRTTIKSRFYLY